MKKLLFAALLAAPIFASGKLSYKAGVVLKSGELSHQFGFGIYEKIAGPLSYNGWTGVGWLPRGNNSLFYAVSTQDLEVWAGDLGLAAGFSLKHAEKELVDVSADHDVHLKLTLKLW